MSTDKLIFLMSEYEHYKNVFEDLEEYLSVMRECVTRCEECDECYWSGCAPRCEC